MGQKYELHFLTENNINLLIKESEKKAENKELVRKILEKALEAKGITDEEAAVLLSINDTELLEEMFETARKIKEKIYGKRIVMKSDRSHVVL